MSKPIRHHIVPQCYLEAFTNSNGKLFVLPKDETRNSFEASTNNVAVRKHYYSFENESGEIDVKIETALAGLEGIAKPILRAIKSKSILTKQQKNDLSVFIGILYSRNPNFRDGAEEYLRQSIEKAKSIIFDRSKDIEELIRSAPDEIVSIAGGRDEVRDWCKGNLKVVMSPESSLQYINLGIEISKLLANMRWQFLINNNPTLPFITSDNPCYVTNKTIERTPYGVGIGHQDSRLHLPISPEIFLIADWLGKHTEYNKISNKTQIVRINSRTIRHAEAEVYASVLTPEIHRLHAKNKDYAFKTLINHVGPYQITRRKLVRR